MNLAYTIARKIARPEQKSFSSFIILIATIAVALSMAVIVVSTSLVNGFTSTIADKVYGFWGHIHVYSYGSSGNPTDQHPIILDSATVHAIQADKSVRSITKTAAKPAVMLNEGGAMEKIFIKGVDANYDWTAFSSYLVEGSLPITSEEKVSRDLLVSKATAKRMELKVGDKVNLYFIVNDSSKPIARKFKVCGIYNSGLEEFDKLYALGDIRVIQRLNRWTDGEGGNYEIAIKHPSRMEEVNSDVYYRYLPGKVFSETIRDVRPNIFDWLDLQKVTGFFVLSFMLVVAVLNMIIALLILILDRTYMVGTLKSIGGNNNLLQRVFLFWSGFIIVRGIVIGNLIGIGLCLLQKYTGLIKLPEDAYYVKTAPIKIDWLLLIGINLGTVVLCLICLTIPAYIVMKRISPIKAIRFN